MSLNYSNFDQLFNTEMINKTCDLCDHQYANCTTNITTKSTTKYLILCLPTKRETWDYLSQDFIPEFFPTQIINFNPNNFSSQYIRDENSIIVPFKTVAAINFINNNHYTIYRRTLDEREWIYIDSLSNNLGNIKNFPNNLNNVYGLVLKIL
jgi:hypothetical protein